MADYHQKPVFGSVRHIFHYMKNNVYYTYIPRSAESWSGGFLGLSALGASGVINQIPSHRESQLTSLQSTGMGDTPIDGETYASDMDTVFDSDLAGQTSSVMYVNENQSIEENEDDLVISENYEESELETTAILPSSSYETGGYRAESYASNSSQHVTTTMTEDDENEGLLWGLAALTGTAALVLTIFLFPSLVSTKKNTTLSVGNTIPTIPFKKTEEPTPKPKPVPQPTKSPVIIGDPEFIVMGRQTDFFRDPELPKSNLIYSQVASRFVKQDEPQFAFMRQPKDNWKPTSKIQQIETLTPFIERHKPIVANGPELLTSPVVNYDFRTIPSSRTIRFSLEKQQQIFETAPNPLMYAVVVRNEGLEKLDFITVEESLNSLTRVMDVKPLAQGIIVYTKSADSKPQQTVTSFVPNNPFDETFEQPAVENPFDAPAKTDQTVTDRGNMKWFGESLQTGQQKVVQVALNSEVKDTQLNTRTTVTVSTLLASTTNVKKPIEKPKPVVIKEVPKPELKKPAPFIPKPIVKTFPPQPAPKKPAPMKPVKIERPKPILFPPIVKKELPPKPPVPQIKKEEPVVIKKPIFKPSKMTLAMNTQQLSLLGDRMTVVFQLANNGNQNFDGGVLRVQLPEQLKHKIGPVLERAIPAIEAGKSKEFRLKLLTEATGTVPILASLKNGTAVEVVAAKKTVKIVEKTKTAKPVKAQPTFIMSNPCSQCSMGTFFNQ